MRKLKGPKEQIIALGTFTKLLRASESVSTDVHREIVSGGLSVSQFGILEALYHLGPMCQRDLARKILKSAGNLTMVLDNLEKMKLVVRKRSVTDRRYFMVSLTEKGEARIENIFPDHALRINNRMSSLSLQEQQQLSKLLKKLGQQP